MVYGKNLISEFYFCNGQNVFQLTLKKHQKHLMETLKGFTYPQWPNVAKLTIVKQNSHFGPKPRPLGL